MPFYRQPISLPPYNFLSFRLGQSRTYISSCVFKNFLYLGTSEGNVVKYDPKTGLLAIVHTAVNQPVLWMCANKDYIFYITSGGSAATRNIWRSADGITWSLSHSIGPANIYTGIDCNDKGEVAATNQNGNLYYSTDNGATWNSTFLTAGAGAGPNYVKYLPIAGLWCATWGTAGTGRVWYGTSFADLILRGTISFSDGVSCFYEFDNKIFVGGNGSATFIRYTSATNPDFTNLITAPAAILISASNLANVYSFCEFDNSIYAVAEQHLFRLIDKSFWVSQNLGHPLNLNITLRSGSAYEGDLYLTPSLNTSHLLKSLTGA